MTMEASPDIARRSAIHAALGDPHRLTIVDELALADRSPSELAAILGLGSNLLAHHLGVLEGAGLLERLPSAGDRRRHYLRLVPAALVSAAEPMATLVARRVLFVCTGNSARSQLAAAAWNASSAVPASSAGTRPATEVHPEAVRTAARAGLDLSAARPRSVDRIAEEPDLIVTVCDIAHEGLGDRLEGVRALHWSIPDPAPVGTPAAFDAAFQRISRRVASLSQHVRPPHRPRRLRP
jgi:ArsR family transcriptional regulator, arsenate/arsenite/antimonite-responsive transcriptional repressor / arsenate reductase (thioredoxin)